MLRSVLLALAVIPTALDAQRLEPSVRAGLRAPAGGQLVVPVALPATTGFLSVPSTFSERGGLYVSASARAALTETVGVVGGLSVTTSERFAESPGVTACRSCPTRLLSGLLGVSVRRRIGSRFRVETGIGGEWIHLGGEAYNDPLTGPGIIGVEPTRRVVGGTNATVGAAVVLRRGGAVRVDAQLRRYSITSRWTDPAVSSVNGRLVSTPYSDLLLSVGWSPR